ncbi:MAG TPA: protein kinase family protein [Frankiaceae bacterium]|nr:protein kinase family protein [Frankiaceae bacterium]
MTEQLTAAPDTLLAGRYRLQRPVAPRATTTTWRGLDEVLARPVAIKVLDHPERLPGGTAAFLDAAVAAGRLTHPRIASVFDAAEEGGLTYVVSEWVEGRSLAELLASDGPLSPPRATTVTAQVAEAVAYAHSRGVTHRALAADDVIVCTDGAIKVTDFEVGAASRPEGTPLPDEDVPDEERDTRAVAALYYACLTARSVTGAEPELQPAPYRDGRLCAPRQVRAGVPREVDAVVVRTLLPELLKKAEPIRTPAELVAALAPLPGEGGPTRAVPVEDPKPYKPNRLLRIGVPALVVVAVGVVGALTGIAVGRLPGVGQKFPGLTQVSQSPQPAGSAAPGTVVAPVKVTAFDPQGDGEENDNEVSLAHNGDATDAWHTTVYYNSPALGNLKSGVGLLVDLGQPVAVDRLVLAFAEPGESVELRAADALGADASAFPVVASADDVKVPVTLKPRPGTTARYWLVWITKLAPHGEGKYSAAIAEFGFFR